jgi:hypothetical protein
MRWVKATRESGDVCWLNMDVALNMLVVGNNRAKVYFAKDDSIAVQETPEELIRRAEYETPPRRDGE